MESSLTNNDRKSRNFYQEARSKSTHTNRTIYYRSKEGNPIEDTPGKL